MPETVKTQTCVLSEISVRFVCGVVFPPLSAPLLLVTLIVSGKVTE